MRPNPKDEAIEIVNKFKSIAYNDYLTTDQEHINAVQCTLVVVDLMIVNEHLETGDESWWEQVKQELLKL